MNHSAIAVAYQPRFAVQLGLQEAEDEVAEEEDVRYSQYQSLITASLQLVSRRLASRGEDAAAAAALALNDSADAAVGDEGDAGGEPSAAPGEGEQASEDGGDSGPVESYGSVQPVEEDVDRAASDAARIGCVASVAGSDAGVAITANARPAQAWCPASVRVARDGLCFLHRAGLFVCIHHVLLMCCQPP